MPVRFIHALIVLCIAGSLSSGAVLAQQQDVGGLNRRAAELINGGRPAEAEIVARQAIAAAEGLPSGAHRRLRESLLPIAQQRLGVALRLQGRFAEAESLLREALIGADRKHGYQSRLAIKTQINLGLAIQAQGRYADADKQLREALARAPAVTDSETLELDMDARTRLGRLQIQVGNHVEAESLLETAIRESVGDGQQVMRWRQMAFDGLAMLRNQQRRHGESLSYARRSAELVAPAWGERHSNTMNAYANLAKSLFKLGQLDEAEAWSRRAVAIADMLGDEAIGTSSRIYRHLAEILDAKGETSAAEAMYNRALASADSRAHAEIALYTLRAGGDFFSRNGKPDVALPLYERAVALADKLFALSRGLSDAARETKVERLRPIYGEAILNRVRLDAKSPGQGHDRAALSDVSRTQSRLFTEMLRTADVARLVGDDAFVKLKSRRDDLLLRLDSMQRHLALTARIDDQGETIEPARPIDDPFILERWKKDVLEQRGALKKVQDELESIEAGLWREYPRYMELEDPRPVSVADLQRDILRPGEHLLAYFRLKNQLLIFMVARDEFRLVRVPVERKELDALIARVRAPMEAGGRIDALAELDPEVLHRLYSLLLEPVRDALPEQGNLLVIGDGPLYALPLEMLVTHWSAVDRQTFETAKSPDLSQYATLDYVGAHWRFSYAPSLAALAIQRAAAARPGKAGFEKSLIAFADPVFQSHDATPGAATRSLLQSLGAMRGDQVSIPRLPETADEVNAVAAIVGGRNTLLLREAAQESRVKHDDLSAARYLHFATHGLLGGDFARLKDYAGESATDASGTRNIVIEDADELQPEAVSTQGQPALVLTLVGDLGGEDGLLTMNEVMGLKMNAELVVLSACNTAGERVEARNGEGFAGLTRAFMHAGARGLLVSHWSVESLATRDLITDFFRRRQAGAGTAEALSGAQADIRVSRDQRLRLSRAHPFFWAPFVHVGE